jgi:hypothetical protein
MEVGDSCRIVSLVVESMESVSAATRLNYFHDYPHNNFPLADYRQMEEISNTLFVTSSSQASQQLVFVCCGTGAGPGLD